MKYKKICYSTLMMFAIQGSASADPLRGVVEVQDKLDPLPSEVLPGKVLTDEVFRSRGDGEWFPVPPWLAGVWQTISALQISKVDQLEAEEDATAKTIPVGEQETFGFQSDVRKQIWTPAHSYLFSEASVMGSDHPKSMRINAPVASGNDKFCLRTTDLFVTIEPDGKQIKSILRRQLVRCLHRLDSDTVAALYTLRTYDVSGIPISTSRQVRIMRKTDEFKPRDSIDDRDLRSAFSKFLEKTGHVNLIPPRAL